MARSMDLALSALGKQPVSRTARARICLTYLWRHEILPDLDNPQSFNEWVQWRKLHDRDGRLPLLADKLRVKDIVADRIGSEWIIPTYWHGTELPTEPVWPTPFVVKSRHGCNQHVFVFDATANWDAIRRRAQKWMNSEYGFWLDEWLYRQIPRGLLIEPFIGKDKTLPIDYKFYVFGGRVEYVQVHLDRGGRHRWILFDRAWHRVSAGTTDPDPLPPYALTQMIEAAEELGRGFDFVRVDLYEASGKPLFGEMTFYPGSGLDPFAPTSLDAVIGAHWSKARLRP
jgi:TupA-like ATPgrasp